MTIAKEELAKYFNLTLDNFKLYFGVDPNIVQDNFVELYFIDKNGLEKTLNEYHSDCFEYYSGVVDLAEAEYKPDTYYYKR